MKEMICIVCPRGCRLTVDETRDYAVTGNACPRGAVYGKNELLHPVRTVTSTVRLEGGPEPRLPVKTDREIPKDKVFACMAQLANITVAAPIKTGDVLARNVCGTQANIVATRTMGFSKMTEKQVG